MAKNTKNSTYVAGAGAIATTTTIAVTAQAVVGGSAATIMSVTAGTIITAAAPVALAGVIRYGLFKLFED
ncbi:hypothetical protein ACEN3H_12775 [Acinetobacter lactucae]|uniref:hypothetical protein n=1 Tax=Acinetobacter lactucae TaxID=1785128 RepID=UPI00358DAFC4